MKTAFKSRRRASSKNDGAMADIAFLLLIFFMLCTVIFNESGIMVKLPEWSNQPVSGSIKGKELPVYLNGLNQVMVGEHPIDFQSIERDVSKFLNASSHRGLPIVISFYAHRGAMYDRYLEVYDGLIGAINEFKDQKAMTYYGRPYNALSNDEIRELLAWHPVVISESDAYVSN